MEKDAAGCRALNRNYIVGGDDHANPLCAMRETDESQTQPNKDVRE